MLFEISENVKCSISYTEIEFLSGNLWMLQIKMKSSKILYFIPRGLFKCNLHPWKTSSERSRISLSRKTGPTTLPPLPPWRSTQGGLPTTWRLKSRGTKWPERAVLCSGWHSAGPAAPDPCKAPEAPGRAWPCSGHGVKSSKALFSARGKRCDQDTRKGPRKHVHLISCGQSWLEVHTKLCFPH